MIDIVQLSDLHFGTEDAGIAAQVLADIDGTNGPRPALVAISGDLTQRARPSEFRAARAFLDRIPGPYLVVPGNHDVPLFDLISRFARPYDRYRTFITPDLSPVQVLGDELVAVGLTTPYGSFGKNGRITPEALEIACEHLARYPRHWKVIVAHHPLELAKGDIKNERVDGAEEALRRFAKTSVDLILTGHYHVAATADDPAARSPDDRIISVHAGTAMSHRLRGEPNGYNRLVFSEKEVHVIHRRWDGTRFVDALGQIFSRNRQPIAA